jgi:hypothetical protein
VLVQWVRSYVPTRATQSTRHTVAAKDEAANFSGSFVSFRIEYVKNRPIVGFKTGTFGLSRIHSGQLTLGFPIKVERRWIIDNTS